MDLPKRHNFKKLKIWLMGVDIANDVYTISAEFPQFEMYGLKSQMNRSSISIPSNIAEGSSRSDKSFILFLDISLGSSYELQTQLILAKSRAYIEDEKASELEEKIENFQRATMIFQNTLKS